MKSRRFIPLLFFTLVTTLTFGKEWYVKQGAAKGDGSSASPFGMFVEAIHEAMPGDMVLVQPGTYNEPIETMREGKKDAPITIKAEEGYGSVIITKKANLLRVAHPYCVIDGFIFDAQYANDDCVKIDTGAHYTLLKNCEVRRTSKDGIDIDVTEHVTIDNCCVHHCLNAQGGRTDAHAMVGVAVRDLTIRNTRAYSFSGDAFQTDPSRKQPGWDRVLIENCIFWLEPLPQKENGFEAGTVPGENALDTKVWEECPFRAKVTIRNTIASGFRAGLIDNMAAFNLKEKIDAVLDGVTVTDSEIAFRVRGPSKEHPGGAIALIQNAVVYDLKTAVRYEDEPAGCTLVNSTFGTKINTTFEVQMTEKMKPTLQNCLFIGKPILPFPLSSDGNLVVESDSVVNTDKNDYHLSDLSKAINTGNVIQKLRTDRDGVSRPQGSRYDTGAYEWNGEKYKLPVLSAELMPPPHQFKGEADTSNSSAIKLSWTDKSINEDFFEIEYSEDGKIFEKKVFKENTTSGVLDGLKGGTLYSLRARSGNRLGISTWTDITKIETSATAEPPAPPKELAAKHSQATITLSWTDKSDVEDGFEIEKSTDGKTFAALQKAAVNAVSFEDTQIKKNTTYWYRLRSFNKAGPSAYTEPVMVEVKLVGKVPAAPTKLSFTKKSSSVSLTWNDNATDEDGYELEKSDDNEVFHVIKTLRKDSKSIDDGGLRPGAFYWYRVRAFNENGKSEYSNTVSASIQPPERIPKR
jgi:hypothetical protein